MAQSKLQLGDSVVVKPHVEEAHLNINIGGWQGRISEISEAEGVICINWDSITLQQIPSETVEQCEREGLYWTEMYLYPTDVELGTARDNEEDVEDMIAYLEDKYSWSSFGEQGQRIQAVLDKAKNSSEMAIFKAWKNHLQEVLKYPFTATVSEWQERGSLRTGDEVTVLGIEGSEDLYGILVSLRRKRHMYVFPLCDLEVSNKSSVNYQPVKDYVVWFANR